MADLFDRFTDGMADAVDRYLEGCERDGHHWSKDSEQWSAYKEGVHDAVAVVTQALIQVRTSLPADLTGGGES